MNVESLPAEGTFRTAPLRGLPTDADIDRKARVIRGVKAMQAGPLNDGDMRNQEVDSTTLEQLTEFVNRSNTGVKMRFSHPNMSRDGMGRHLGRAKNARIVGEGGDAYVAVDAFISDSSRRSPKGNLADYVMDLAEETPEDFGLSIATLLDNEAMHAASKDRKQGAPAPIRLRKLFAIDFVDEPAATRGGLFDLEGDSLADLPAQATHLLDTFFGDAAPDVVRGRFEEFLGTYFASKGEPMSTDKQPADNSQLTVETADSIVTSLSTEDLAKQQAKAELDRRKEITALCQLAGIPDGDRDLMIEAGFSRADAQEYLKSSGRLSATNPPVDEGGEDAAAKKPTTDEDKFGAEYDAYADLYERQGVSREDYIASRKLD